LNGEITLKMKQSTSI